MENPPTWLMLGRNKSTLQSNNTYFFQFILISMTPYEGCGKYSKSSSHYHWPAKNVNPWSSTYNLSPITEGLNVVVSITVASLVTFWRKFFAVLSLWSAIEAETIFLVSRCAFARCFCANSNSRAGYFMTMKVGCGGT